MEEKQKVFKYKIVSLLISTLYEGEIFKIIPQDYKELRNDYNFENGIWENIVIYDRELSNKETKTNVFILEKIENKLPFRED